jgi:alpha-D-ribose 1-methylphosphonate 5-triphosphate synthase subunit PhnH
MSDALTGGFINAPHQAAHAFRAALNVMARPGLIETLSGALPPTPMSVAAGVLILTLCDRTTPLHLAGDYDCPSIRDWVTFHTGAPLVGAPDASFALGLWADLAGQEFPIGTAEYPDRATSLILEMPHLTATGTRLTGPGIEVSARLSLPIGFDNRAEFPLGLDCFFTCGDRLAALPRSTNIEVI